MSTEKREAHGGGEVPTSRRRRTGAFAASSVLSVAAAVAYVAALHGADSFTLPPHITTTTATSSAQGHRAMGGGIFADKRLGVVPSAKSPSTRPMPPSPLRPFDRPSKFSSTAVSLAPGAVEAAAASAASTSSSDLKLFFLQTLITTGVPAACFFGGLAALVMLIKSSRTKDEESGFGGFMRGGGRAGPRTPAEELYDDIYGPSDDPEPNNPLKKFFGPPPTNGASKMPKNLGVPATQYIKVTRMNDVLSSYDYSMDAATRSKSYAAAKLRGKNFDRALERAFTAKLDAHDGVVNGYGVADLSLPEKYELMRAERELLEKGGKLQEKALTVRRKLTRATVDGAMDRMDVGVLEVDPRGIGVEEDEVSRLRREKEALERRVKFLTEGGKEVDGGDDDDSSFVDAVIEDVNVTSTSASSKSSAAAEEKNGANASDDGKKKWGFGGRKKSSSSSTSSTEPLLRELGTLDASLTRLELSFLETVLEILGPQRANAFRVAVLGNEEGPGGGGFAAGTLLSKVRERPLTHILGDASGSTSGASDAPGGRRKNVFVADFPGDVGASQVSRLREEVTAIVRNAKPGDEAVVVLQSGGGTVTGYGLAAAQLRRFREAGMKLTVCVEQVAASGGYMMCCVADRIVASPFAVLGSIGVISDVPNFYDRLKKEGIEFQTVTAGQYKRTITPTKKVTKEDLDKSKADIEDILVLFKDFVKSNRPVLDIDSVATGETWFGEDALERKLCDEIKTKDEVMLEFVDDGCDVYNVKYEPPLEARAGALSFASGGGGVSTEGTAAGAALLQRPIQWVVRTVAREIRRELSDAMAATGVTDRGIEQRYKVMDASDAANRVKASAAPGGGGGVVPEQVENLDRLF